MHRTVLYRYKSGPCRFTLVWAIGAQLLEALCNPSRITLGTRVLDK